MTPADDNSPYQRQLQAACHAARLGQDIIDRYYQQSFDVQVKDDNTPVTEVDIAVEDAIRSYLIEQFPDYGFYGEESDTLRGDASHLWLVDPIDGTKSFVRHSPFFSTQIALRVDAELVAGVSNAPAMRQLACAATGQGAQLFDTSIGSWVDSSVGTSGEPDWSALAPTRQCSQTRDLASAFLSSGNIGSLSQDSRRWSAYGKLIGSVARVRGYGDFYHYHQLIRGQADLVVESDVNILDIAALCVIVQQAGGVFTDMTGAPVDLETTSVLAAATPELHTAALELLNA